MDSKPVSLGVVAVVRAYLVYRHVYRVPLTYAQIAEGTGVLPDVVRRALSQLRAAADPFALFHTCDKRGDFAA